ncbi:MAG: HAMP domain-containing histidine kinase [Hydrogenophilaceae bacterium]|nr:HAMP domain-containing histidine kinase [Hydrogenophilaceae bacterium]
MLTRQPPAPAATLLRRLAWLRNLAIAGQLLAIGVVTLGLDMPLPLSPMLGIVGLLIVLNGLTWWRLKQPWPASQPEVFTQLAADTVALAGQLFFSGGYANPFVSLLLLPVILAATALSAGYAWLTALFSGTVYSLLIFWHVPLPAVAELDAFNLHLLGMWLNFLISAGLVAWFVVQVAGSLRRREQELAAARERTVRDAGVFALGMQAAGAAHELSTPLATMTVLAQELQAGHAQDRDLAEDLGLLAAQAERCKALLTRLTVSAGAGREAAPVPLDEWLGETIEHWQLMRPTIVLARRIGGSLPAPLIRPDPVLAQALVSFYNNAADASPEDVAIEAEWDARQLRVRVLDRGPGISPELAEVAGRKRYSSKGEGRGIGLLLTHAGVEHLGGEASLALREGGGSIASVTVPLAALEAR